MQGLLTAVRYDSNSSSDGTSDDNGPVMRLFGNAVFVVDGLVMIVLLWRYLLVMVL